MDSTASRQAMVAKLRVLGHRNGDLKGDEFIQGDYL
jgi:hypothetical protein